MPCSSISTGRTACRCRRDALNRVPGARGPGNGRGGVRRGLGNGSVTPRQCLFVRLARDTIQGIGWACPPTYRWVCRPGTVRSRGLGGDGGDRGATSSSPPSMMLFSDFIASKSNSASPTAKKKMVSDEEMDALIERTSGVLKDAVEALQQVRQREARGVGQVGWSGESGGSGQVGGTRTSTSKSTSGRRPNFLSGSVAGSSAGVKSPAAEQPSSLSSSSPSSAFPGSSSSSDFSGSIDGWFRGKVDAGPLMPQQSVRTAASSTPSSLKFKEKPEMPSVLEFTGHFEAPEASVAAMNEVFPEHLALRFQSEVFSDPGHVEFASSRESEVNAAGKMMEENATTSSTTSGEEFGPNGHWYRWTEVSGQNEAGTVVWTERWWEVSDWSGMKELGAEKYGMNEHGDVWRETWTEKIVVEGKNKKPMVLRSAHKWARASGGREWEEKWEEKYWSGGKTHKWADKWGREGGDIWHETWGEDYDGEGTDRCVKWTDRWAESDGNKWGDKWREEFQNGVGEKTGETWSEPVGGEKYQRWWGEKHMGEGRVQKFGNSTTGESWDVVEEMDTYYNPIPHFGYDLALSHSPQLHNVPTLPIDEEIIF